MRIFINQKSSTDNSQPAADAPPKGILSPRKRRHISLQKVAFYNAKGHF